MILEFRAHSDGQTIVLDDHEILPETVTRCKVILTKETQDWTFLHLWLLLNSSEANVRNTWLIGGWNVPNVATYSNRLLLIPWGMKMFPSNPSKSGIHCSFLPWCEADRLWYANQVPEDEQFTSPVFRNVLAGRDGSQRSSRYPLANWYSNGNEIVLIRTKPGLWNKISRRDYASTNQWLMMNGCDHPARSYSGRNLSEAIRVANELFPDVTFVHSSFDDYVHAVGKHHAKHTYLIIRTIKIWDDMLRWRK